MRRRMDTALPWGLLALAHVPLLWRYGQDLWTHRPQYQIAPAILIGALVLAWRRAGDPRGLTPGRPRIVRALLAAHLVLLGVATLAGSPWLAALLAWVMAGGWIYHVGGQPLLRRVWPAWAFAGLAVRPPLNLDRSLVTGLRDVASRTGSAMLDSLGVVHLQSGNVIDIPGERLFVEEACSGVNSLLTLVALTLFALIALRKPVVRSAILIGFAGITTLLANAVRLTAIALAAARWELRLDEGWRHEALGALLFAASLAVLLSLSYLVYRPAAERSGEAEPLPDEAEPSPATPPMAARGPAWRVLIGALVLAVALQLWLYLSRTSVQPPPDGLAAVGQDLAPAAPTGWSGPRYEAVHRARPSDKGFGWHSKRWRYASGPGAIMASLDYPFRGWHDLTNCYRSAGWIIDEVEPSTDGKAPVTVVRMHRPGGSAYAVLRYVMLKDEGAVLTPPSTLVHRWQAAVRRFGDGPGAGLAPVETTQLQLFVERPTPIPDALEAQSAQHFANLLSALRTRLADPEDTHAPAPR